MSILFNDPDYNPYGDSSMQAEQFEANKTDTYNPGVVDYSQASSVSGENNSGSVSPDTSSEDAKKAAEKAEDDARDSIGDQFSSIQSSLDQLLGYLPGQQADSQAKYGVQKEYSYGQTGDALKQAMGRFDGFQDDIMSGQKSTLRDLSSDVRNAFQAGNIYLGSKGASNSSAAGMYSRGIQQAANRNRADVKNQTEGNLADLNIRRTEAQAAAQTQYNAIDNWFNTSVSDLETQFNSRRQEIEMAKVNATSDEMAALNNLDMELWRSAQNVYNQLQLQQNQYSQSVSDAIGNAPSDFATETGDPYAKQTTGEIDNKITTANNGGVGEVYNPVGKKDDEENMLMSASPTFPTGTNPNYDGTYNNQLAPPINYGY